MAIGLAQPASGVAWISSRGAPIRRRSSQRSPHHQARWLIWLDLAEFAVDTAAAEVALVQARATTDMPLLLDDILRARPALTTR